MHNNKCHLHLIHLFLAVFVLFCLLIPVSTVSAKVPDTGEEEWSFSALLYDNSNGLPTSEANAIAQSRNGFIWIGGYSGLIRYDGNDFHRLDSSAGITSVMSLYVDKEDRLWIGTNDNGAVVYDNGEFRFFGKAEGLISLSVRAIVEDASGNIILATTQGMAYIDDNYELHMIEDSEIGEKFVCVLKTDTDGTVYGSTIDGCFFSMENLAVTYFYDGKELGVGEVFCICPDPGEKGKVYLGMGDSAVVCGNMLDGMKDRKVYSAVPQENINDIYLSQDGRIWICADNGVGYFDAKMQYTHLNNFPMNNSVDTMMVDFEDNLWFTSSRQGVMKIVKSPFANITRLAHLENAVVNTTCIYQGDLYIGTDTGLQLLDENGEQKENALTELLEGIRIRSIKADSAGNLWLCTYSDNGLVCYSGDGNYKLYNEEAGLISNWVRTMTELPDGTIAACASGGVNLIQNGSIISAYDNSSGLSNTEILSICEGEDGSIYLGSDGGGIYVIEDDNVRHLGVEDGLKSEIILRLKKDPKSDIYWIITSNSISYMQDEKIQTLSNFPYSNNFDMYFDDNGGVWILSSNGIYVVNRDNLLADGDIVYSFYDMSSGLPYITTANSRSYLSPDGTLYISGSSGVCSININKTGDKVENVKLVVPFLEIDDEMIYLNEGETVTIPSDCKRITIYGYALTYALQNPRLNYYLEGFDEEVTSVSRHELQPVSYTNLDSGEYVFHLSVIDVMTGEETNSIAVRLVKEKAFYEQVWFWIMVNVVIILLLLLAGRTYTRHKMKKLIKKQEENDRFINQMIHMLAKSIDLKDKYTNGHSFRVAEYTKMIAEKMGYSKAEVNEVYKIGLLHDIGKITIPDNILNKPGKLTNEEFTIMKQHAINGHDILKEIETSPELALGAGFHHERMDGKGYPFGKDGDEIPNVAQIIAVADTFDAMNSTRPYREKMKMEDIVEELKRVAGTQLNEKYVQVLLTLIEEGRFDD